MEKTLHRIGEILIVASLMAVGAGPAEALTASVLPTASAPAAAGGETRPIQAWLKFCEQHLAECAIDDREPVTVRLTRQVWQELVAVNTKVNATIAPLTDEAHWGMPDIWDFADDGYGDCEDYQLRKRQLLVDAGLPRRALRMTVVIDEKGEGHAVLMARTDRGDFILDNKIQGVLPWHQTGYIFIKRESQYGPTWISLGGAMSPVTTANR
jgi:predicted transglutaminase-like cysteine proteinase